MKSTLLFLVILIIGARPLFADVAAPTAPYTTNTLLQLIKAKDANLIDQDAFDSMVQKRGVDFSFNTQLILNLSRNTNFTDANILEMEQVFQKLATNAATVLATNSDNAGVNNTPKKGVPPPAGTNQPATSPSMSKTDTNSPIPMPPVPSPSPQPVNQSTNPIPASAQKLESLMVNNLTNNFPTIDQLNLGLKAPDIALSASDAASSTDLYANLTNAFNQDLHLTTTNNSDLVVKTAWEIANEFFNPNMPSLFSSPPAKIAVIATNDVWLQTFLWTGVKLDNPYSINTTSGKLQSAGSSTDGYLEMELSTRYVFRSGASDEVAASDPWQADDKPHFISFTNLSSFLREPDFDLSLGYVFRGSSAPTNYVASTIAGGSDLYSDISIGIPLVRDCSLDYSRKFQLTAELSGGFVTDKDFLTVHPNFFAGAGGQWKFAFNGGSGYLITRAGMAMIDQPKFTSGSTVAINNIGEPEFDDTWAPSLGTVFMLPILPAISLQAGGNTYFTHSAPASWNITLGITLDLSKFFGALGASGGKTP